MYTLSLVTRGANNGLIDDKYTSKEIQLWGHVHVHSYVNEFKTCGKL